MTINRERSDGIVAALILTPAVVLLAGCTSGLDPEPVTQEPPLGVVSPVEQFDDERLFTYGQPALSEYGTGSGTYDLPESLTVGQTVMVTASCSGGEEVSIETDEGFFGMRGSCSSSSGVSTERPVESVIQDSEVTVDVGDGNAYWLNLFVVDPTEPALSEPTSPEEQTLQDWSVETVVPKGDEIYRWVGTPTEPVTETVDVTPGTYRWAVSCRDGDQATFTVSVDDDITPTSISCDGPGGIQIFDVFSVEEPTTIEFTTNTGPDMTFALARQR